MNGPKDSAPKERQSCSFKNDMTKKGKGKGKRDRPSSLSPEPRSRSEDSREGKGALKGKFRDAPVLQVDRISLRVSAIWMQGARNRHAIVGIRPNVENRSSLKVANVGKSVHFFRER